MFGRLLEPLKESLEVKRWVKPVNSRIDVSDIEYMDADRVYITINDMFDLRVVRTDEGIVVDIYPSDDAVQVDESLASTYVFDDEVTVDGWTLPDTE